MPLVKPEYIAWIRKYKNVLIFGSGFLFDVFTIDRIDAAADIAIQLAYILGLTSLLIFQVREHNGMWTPAPWQQRIWKYNVEILHFLYGGLLSAYVILYFRSSSASRTVVFFTLLGVLLILNEMPQIRRVGHQMRMALYSFCICSFLIYFIPILIGRMGNTIFILSVISSGLIVWFVSGFLTSKGPHRTEEKIRIFMPALAFFLLIITLYSLRLIPPVPLSLQYQGIFHKITVDKESDSYIVRTPKPPFYAFWRRDSRPFEFTDKDSMYYFIRVFAPSRFNHKALVRWSQYNETQGEFLETDRVPIKIVGGRDQGFRAYVAKSNFEAGKWKVSTETSDGRLIGSLKFKIEKDVSTQPRNWVERKM